MFAHSLKRFSLRDWSIEQKWMSVLLPLLLLYNGNYIDFIFTSEEKSFHLGLHWRCSLQWRCSSQHKSSYFLIDKGQVAENLKQSKDSVLV